MQLAVVGGHKDVVQELADRFPSSLKCGAQVTFLLTYYYTSYLAVKNIQLQMYSTLLVCICVSPNILYCGILCAWCRVGRLHCGMQLPMVICPF